MKFSFRKTACTALLVALSSSTAAYSQDIYLIDYTQKNGAFTFRTAVNITSRTGYDNQPSFHPDGKAIFFSAQYGNQNDIYKYDLRKNELMQLTDTAEISEYSPTVTPDEKYFSVIQLMNADNGRQPLSKFPAIGGGAQHIFENDLKVGYHAWADNENVAMFILGSPNSLQVFDTGNETLYEITNKIGRCLKKVPDRYEISFTQEFTDNKLYIKKIDMKTKGITTIIQLKTGNEHYDWTPERILITGVGSKLFKFHPGKDTEWIEIADLSDYGISGITRLAISPQGNKMAIVANDASR